MVIISHGHGLKQLKRHLRYIACHAASKQKELVARSENIKPANVGQTIKDWAKAIEPILPGQRRLKRTDIRLIASWIGEPPAADKVAAIVEDFRKAMGYRAIHAWAVHQKPDRYGRPSWHVHFVMAPRSSRGDTIDIRRDDLRRIKAAYVDVSNKWGLDIGYDSRVLKQPKATKAKRKRKAKSQTQKAKQTRAKWAARNRNAKKRGVSR